MNLSFEFVYVIFLKSADGHKIGDDFPKYFKYQYGADIYILAKTALGNNHLSKSSSLYNVEKAKVSEIKNILKKHDLKASGRKKDFIERITENLTEDDIKSDFPDSYCTLTDNGRNFLKENDYIIYYHKSQNLSEIPIEIYHELLKDNNDPNLKICIIDLSGLSNGNQYMSESIILAPGIINFIKRSLSKLELDAENIEKEYYSFC